MSLGRLDRASRGRAARETEQGAARRLSTCAETLAGSERSEPGRK
jgi:hypothetical protein